MIGEIRRLDPKPGLKFGASRMQTVVPDVYVRPGPDGGWHVELNSDTLPRVLVNQVYYTKLSKTIRKDGDKSYFTDCLQNATWLVRALDQRARTILKVATEIVRQQDGFFTHGVAHLRPLNLKAVADAIQMHESTVSRVTANKYMATNRGSFELKYFFTASIASADGGEAHSAEAVRHHIKQLIDAEERGGDPVRRHHRGTIARDRALISPAAPSRNTAKRCGSRPRCSAAATNRACLAMPFRPPPPLPTAPATPHRLDCAPAEIAIVSSSPEPIEALIMTLRISGKSISIGEALRDRVSERTEEVLRKYFDGNYSGHITLSKDGFGFRTDCALHLDSGITLEADSNAADAYASADQALLMMEKRLRRYKSRLKDRSARKAYVASAALAEMAAPTLDAPSYVIEAPASDGEDEVSGYNAVIIAEATTSLRRLSVSEAVMELDLTGAACMVFQHGGSGRVNIIYRRADGNVGWIDPPSVNGVGISPY